MLAKKTVRSHIVDYRLFQEKESFVAYVQEKLFKSLSANFLNQMTHQMLAEKKIQTDS